MCYFAHFGHLQSILVILGDSICMLLFFKGYFGYFGGFGYAHCEVDEGGKHHFYFFLAKNNLCPS